MSAEMPDPPHEVFDAIDSNSFFIFIGAGVSRSLGCSSWDDLFFAILDECLSRGWFTPTIHKTYKKDRDRKKVLNKCKLKFQEFGEIDRYYEIIHDSCKGKEEAINSYNIYDELKKVPSKYVTTNFDLLFSNKFHEDSVVYKNDDFNPNDIKREVLYQIHGSLKDNDSIVLTTVDYTKKYTNQNYQNFLKALFTENLILFLGYGLSEMEILVPLFNNVISERPHENFALRGYSNQTSIFKQDDIAHYSTLGINLISYTTEIKGYNFLFDIIAYWNKEIEKKCDSIFHDLDQLKRVIK